MLLFVFHTYSGEGYLVPEDEVEAREMLERGELDSTFWYLIEPLYSDPISVPAGELEILATVFDLIPQDKQLWNKKNLSHYEPWDKREQERFFNDYPLVRFVKPLLTFDKKIPNGSQHLTLSAQSRRSMFRKNVITTLTVGASAKRVSLEGTLSMDEYKARWYERSICFDMGKVGYGQIGGFDPLLNRTLFYGVFDNNDSIKAQENWLYPLKKGWNGGRYALIKDRFYHELFYHRDLQLSIVSVLSEFTFIKKARMYGALSFHKGNDGKQSIWKNIIVHGGAYIDGEYVKGELHTGVYFDRHHKKIPLTVSLRMGKRHDGAVIRLFYFPPYFNGVLSKQFTTIVKRLKVPLYSSYAYGGGEGTFTRRFLKNYSLGLNYHYFGTVGTSYVMGKVSLERRGDITHTLWGRTWKQGRDSSWSYVVAHRMNAPIGFITLGSTMTQGKSYGVWNMGASLRVKVFLKENITGSIINSVRFKEDTPYQWTIGLLQSVNFFHKNRAFVRITYPIKNSAIEQPSFSCGVTTHIK